MTAPDSPNSPRDPSLWALAGGEPAVRAVTAALVERMRQDIMIGFFFRRTQAARLAELEFQHASSHLGGPVGYLGRPLAQAHARFAIGHGHFARRRLLLAEVLAAHAVPDRVARHWLRAQDQLIGDIVAEASGCPTRTPSEDDGG